MYISDQRELKWISVEVIDTIINFLSSRFYLDNKYVNIMKPFFNMNFTANIEKLYKLVGPDLSLWDLYLEYGEILESNNIEIWKKKMNLSDLVKSLSSSKYYQNVLTVLTRILINKPHSAYVEKLISTSNILN